MKKLISVLIASVMLATGCGQSAQNTATPSASANPPAATNLAAELTGEIAGEITVSAYEASTYKNFLEEAAKGFEAKYPGTKVNVETFSAMPEVKTSEQDGRKMMLMTMEKNPQAENDYIYKINNDLMSGNAADILAMDILPYYKYADSNQLEDISAYMAGDPDFNISDYRENIFESAKYNGGLYALPLDYSFDYFLYDETFFTDEQKAALESKESFTYDELMALGLEPLNAYNSYAEEKSKLFGLNANGFFNEVLREKYSEFLDIQNKKANFDDGSFAQLLETSQNYVKEGLLNESMGPMLTSMGEPGDSTQGPKLQQGPPQQNQQDGQQIQGSPQNQQGSPQGPVTIGGPMNQRQEKPVFKSQTSMNLLQMFSRNSNLVMRLNASSMPSDDDKIAGIAANSDGTVSFSSSQAYGINSASENKELAWAFIKYLLSEEVQSSLSLMNIPVNKEAAGEKAKLNIAGNIGPQGVIDASAELDEEQQKIYDEYMKALDKYSAMINSSALKDSSITNIIMEEVEAFFSGGKSAEETAKVIQNKTNLYLNE